LGEREKRDKKRQDDPDGILAPMAGRLEVIHKGTLPQMGANSYEFLRKNQRDQWFDALRLLNGEALEPLTIHPYQIAR
jgi:hypothetical protein